MAALIICGKSEQVSADGLFIKINARFSAVLRSQAKLEQQRSRVGRGVHISRQCSAAGQRQLGENSPRLRRVSFTQTTWHESAVCVCSVVCVCVHMHSAGLGPDFGAARCLRWCVLFSCPYWPRHIPQKKTRNEQARTPPQEEVVPSSVTPHPSSMSG